MDLVRTGADGARRWAPVEGPRAEPALAPNQTRRPKRPHLRGEQRDDHVRDPLGRRAVLKGSSVALATLAAPAILRAAEPPAIKVGVLAGHRALAMDGEFGRTGAEFAIGDVNAKGGIKSLGGAKLEMVFGDARSNPEAGSRKSKRMQSEGVVAVVGVFASPICLAASQARRAMICPMWWMWASPTRSCSAG